MKYAMVIASTICIVIGIWPQLLYSLLPYPVDFIPYTGNHVVSQLHLLFFSALAFFISLKYLERTLTLTLDIDWLYRGKIKYIKLLTKYIFSMVNKTENIFSFTSLRNKFTTLEDYLLRQTTISAMLILILIIFSVSLVMNIS